MSTEDTLIEASTGEADTPLASDELRRVDKAFLELMRSRAQDADDGPVQRAWADSRGLLPETLEAWGMGYVSPKILNIRLRTLEPADLMRAGLIYGRRLKPHEVREERDHKHALDSDGKDHRRPLLGYRATLGGRIAFPLRDHHGAIRTWIGRLVDDSRSLRDVAGDYDKEEADPYQSSSEVAKYLNLGKERCSRLAGGAEEKERFPITLSPGFIARCSGLVLSDTFDPSLELGKTEHDKLTDKTTAVWLTEGHLDAVLASQGGASSLAAGGCRTEPRQHLELVRLLTKFAAFGTPIYLCFDLDPKRVEKDKDIELGPGQRGMCDLLARIWAKDLRLARHIRIVNLPQPSEGGGKNDLADELAAVYRLIPKPVPAGTGPEGIIADGLAWASWSEQVKEAQKKKLEELAATSSVESWKFLISQLPDEVPVQDRSAALRECGLEAVAAHDPELWEAMLPEVTAKLKVDPKEAKRFSRRISKEAVEHVRAQRLSSSDPLTRHTTETGKIDPCYDGIRALIEHIEAQAGPEDPRLWWNEMELQTFLGDVAMTDCRMGDLRTMLGRRWKCDIKHKSDLREVLDNVAQKNPKHPVREYFKKIQTDGETDYIPQLMDAMGLEPASENQWTLWHAELWRWTIGCCARAHATPEKPVKFDTVLTLVGDQGAKKSSWFEAMCPVESWYGAPDISDFSDASTIKLAGLWLAVMEESNGTSYWKDIERQKAFISKKTDRIIRKYVAYAETVARTWGLGATVNEKQFLMDPTGFRRQWMLMISKPIDLEKVKALRDKVWAQAYAAYKAGEQWWLTPTEEELHKADGAAYQAPNLELDKVRRWVDNQTKTVLMGLDIALGIDMERPSCGDSKRIKNHMIALGWRADPSKYGQRYTAPEGWRPGGLKVLDGGLSTPDVSEFDLNNPPPWFITRHG